MAVYCAFLAGRVETSVAGVGLLAVFVFLAAVIGRAPSLVPWAVVIAGAAYTVALIVRGERIDALAPVYAACLLVVAELGYWVLERPVPGERGLQRRRLGLLFVTALAGGGSAAVVLALSELAIEGGVLLLAVGVAAAVAVLVPIVVFARRHAVPPATL